MGAEQAIRQETSMLLKEKTLIVSGIGPGLGIKLAIEAARHGARGVVLAARSADKLDEAEEQVRSLGTDCEVIKVPTDITDAAQCARLAQRAQDTFGRIDALVNSAYNPGDVTKLIGETDLGAWRPVLETNLLGTMTLTNAVVSHMKQQRSGSVVMINSMVTRKPLPGQAGYAISKGALAIAAKYLAQELGPHGIRVNTVSMGWMWGTPVKGYMEHVAQTSDVSVEQQVAAVAANIPLGRIPSDDECARAALFMASDYASAVTGAWLDANGGEFMP
jgi:NAD(P)-dependent dehydrogenase (short-subunit alcohol dehydrogenase family)